MQTIKLKGNAADITININGIDHAINAPGINGKRAHNVIREQVIALGFDWVAAHVFIVHWPERGRALVKKPGSNKLLAYG